MSPEEWPGLFTRHLNAGDVESLCALYEPNAQFATPAGDSIIGRSQIQAELAQLIRPDTKLESQVVRAVVVGDVAMLYTDFEGTTTNASGDRVPANFKAIEVVRQQPEGTWKLVIGDLTDRNR